MMLDKPLRILHVIGGMDNGGAESLIMNIFRNIDRDYVEFDFVVHTDKKCYYEDEIGELGGNIVGRMSRFTGLNCIGYKDQWEHFFDKHKEYRILHAHIRSSAPIFLPIAKSYGLKTIVHSHGTKYGDDFASYCKQLLTYPIRFQSDYLFSCSELAAKKSFGNSSKVRQRITIFHNAIDLDKYRYSCDMRKAVRSKYRLENKLVIGHVGRFVYAKNHSYLIRIFRELSYIYPNAVLLLVGDGELKEQIRNETKELGIENKVIFTGTISNVNEVMQAMDLFLFPSRFEGFPVSLVEAQATGLNCLISDKITEEVDITPLVHRLSIEESVKQWVNYIVKLIPILGRHDGDTCIMKLKNAGYDIYDSAKMLEKFYYEIIR